MFDSKRYKNRLSEQSCLIVVKVGTLENSRPWRLLLKRWTISKQFGARTVDRFDETFLAQGH